MTHFKSNLGQMIMLLLITCLYYSCQKKESKERNTIMFNENIDSVRIMLHSMTNYLEKLPPDSDGLSNYYVKDSQFYVNGARYIIDDTSSDLSVNIRSYLKSNPDLLSLAYRLNENGITASLPYTQCKKPLYYYRPTIENHRGDDRYIGIEDSTGCKYLVNNNDTILDRYKEIVLIANKANPVHPIE